MDKKLHDAAIKNDVTTLRELIRQDPLILDKAALNNNDQDMNPLHVAAMFGNVEFVKEVLGVSPDLCLAGDRFGRNPLHLAVIKGRSDVVGELILFKFGPAAARETADGGGNALHLCVKYNQLKALMVLLDAVKDTDYGHRKDDQGMTVLHLAVCYGLTETVKQLVEVEEEKCRRVDVNAKNVNGSTALDLCHKDIDPEIPRILKSAGAKRGSTVEKYSEWLSEKKSALFIVTTLVAGMAFQAGINPAGGVWNEDTDKDKLASPPSSSSSNHSAGEAVMAYQHEGYYAQYIRVNTVAFVSSLSIILLLLSGLPFRNRFFSWALIVAMWLTITAIALTYAISIVIVTPESESHYLSQVINIGVTVWCGVMSLLLLGNTIRLMNKWLIRSHRIDVLERPRKLWNSAFQRQTSSNKKKPSSDEKC